MSVLIISSRSLYISVIYFYAQPRYHVAVSSRVCLVQAPALLFF